MAEERHFVLVADFLNLPQPGLFVSLTEVLMAENDYKDALRRQLAEVEAERDKLAEWTAKTAQRVGEHPGCKPTRLPLSVRTIPAVEAALKRHA